jgi:protease I
MATLENKKVAFLATNGYEPSELESPWNAVTDQGAKAVLVSPEGGTISAKDHSQSVDVVSADAKASDYDALVLPGGVGNADAVRLDSDSVQFVRGFFDQNKPVAVICHGAWILTDADVASGRTLTSFPSLRTDLENAGSTWVDQEVVVDGKLVSSRTPDDLPAFNEALTKQLA